MLPSLGQIVTSKSDTLEAEISTSLPPPFPVSRHPLVTDDLRSSIVRPPAKIGLVSLYAPETDRHRRVKWLHKKCSHVAIGD